MAAISPITVSFMVYLKRLMSALYQTTARPATGKGSRANRHSFADRGALTLTKGGHPFILPVCFCLEMKTATGVIP
jgi:hypothetical protein